MIARFLLASLHVESLASAAALSIRHVRKKLETLPTTLVGTYDEAMRRIEAQEPDHRAIALKALSWVSYAFRSLSLGELQHALAIEPGQSELDEELLMDGHSITALCAGLVIVDLGTNTVNLVHYTAKKYFESIRLVRFPGFHASITMSCATYLALRELKDASVWQIARQYPLACYAAEYMGEHARHNPEETLEPSILQVICQLLSHPEKRKPLLSLLDGLDLIKSGFYYTTDAEPSAEGADSAVVEATVEVKSILLEERSTFSTAPTAAEDGEITLDRFEHDGCDFEALSWETKTKPSHMPEVTALHLAASMGLAKVASLLINEVKDIDAVDETGKTALAVAMERGFEKAVEFLVNSGASVDLGSEHGQGVFLLINESDWHRVAEVVASKARLMASKDDKNDTQYPVRLLLAAYCNDNTEAQQLIDKGNISFSGRDRNAGANALFVAVERGHAAMVQTLLVSGVAVDSTDSRGQTALHRATRRGCEPLISLLLKHGAEVDPKNDEGRTPWSANLRTRNWHSLSVLIKAGANPNTKGHQGVSELYEAATNGETDVVKFMIENGTDPSIKTQFLWAPLHWASYYGHLSCVKLLIDAGADLSPISDQDATPLDLALRANQIAVVDVLTRAGAKESRDIVISTPSTPSNEVQPSDDWSSTLPSPEGEGRVRTKLSLAFDKPLQQGMQVGQFAYPSTVKAPRDYIYQISHDLETLAPSLGVRQAQRRADMVEYPLAPEAFDVDDALFDIVRVASDYQTFEIGPRTQSNLVGSVSMHRDWTGGWKIHHNHDGIRDYLFRTTPDWSKVKEESCRWSTEDGTLLARTGVQGVTPVFTFEHGSDRQMQDILVTCWIAKLWSETVALQRRGGQAALSKE
jgi:ankyrin repeat protein